MLFKIVFVIIAMHIGSMIIQLLCTNCPHNSFSKRNTLKAFPRTNKIGINTVAMKTEALTVFSIS